MPLKRQQPLTLCSHVIYNIPVVSILYWWSNYDWKGSWSIDTDMNDFNFIDWRTIIITKQRPIDYTVMHKKQCINIPYIE
jgi:hypothetical protein